MHDMTKLNELLGVEPTEIIEEAKVSKKKYER